MSRVLPMALACVIFIMMLNWAANAPEHLPGVDDQNAFAVPFEIPPFGTDRRGRPLLDYATQGAAVVVWPACFAGILTAFFATMGGMLRAIEWSWLDATVQALGEILGALPRMVVVLIIALMMDREQAQLMPIAIAWAILSAPGAMDEAAAVAERLGGSRFVEALRAHGFSASRIYFHHLVVLNLRPVVLRQAGEVMMQVVFLEIALSALSSMRGEPSLTHSDQMMSWADLLIMGYPAVFLDEPGRHALDLGLGLVAMIAIMSLCITWAGRSR